MNPSVLKQPKFDILAAFAQWYTSMPQFIVPQCPFDGVRRIGAFTGLTLHKGGPFLVELWICDPNSEIPDHSHPNIDTIQVYLSGQIDIWKGGTQALKSGDAGVLSGGSFVRTLPGEVHSGRIGALGAAFMNIEHWIQGEPTSAVDDWDGKALDAAHAYRNQPRPKNISDFENWMEEPATKQKHAAEKADDIARRSAELQRRAETPCVP